MDLIHRGILSCFLVSLGTISFGYPAVIVASTLAKPSFLKYMGLGDENGIYPHKQDMAGTITSLFQVSQSLSLSTSKSLADTTRDNDLSCLYIGRRCDRHHMWLRDFRPLWTQECADVLLDYLDHRWDWSHCGTEHGHAARISILCRCRQFCILSIE